MVPDALAKVPEMDTPHIQNNYAFFTNFKL